MAHDVIGYPHIYRIVIKAVTVSRPKSFCWEIVHEDRAKRPVETSAKPYRSMAAAFFDGAIAIRRFR